VELLLGEAVVRDDLALLVDAQARVLQPVEEEIAAEIDAAVEVRAPALGLDGEDLEAVAPGPGVAQLAALREHEVVDAPPDPLDGEARLADEGRLPLGLVHEHHHLDLASLSAEIEQIAGLQGDAVNAEIGGVLRRHRGHGPGEVEDREAALSGLLLA